MTSVLPPTLPGDNNLACVPVILARFVPWECGVQIDSRTILVNERVLTTTAYHCAVAEQPAFRHADVLYFSLDDPSAAMSLVVVRGYRHSHCRYLACLKLKEALIDRHDKAIATCLEPPRTSDLNVEQWRQTRVNLESCRVSLHEMSPSIS